MYAVDVGTAQLHPSLRFDKRVVCMENTNARDLGPEDFSPLPQAAVMDVSFVGQSAFYPVLAALLPVGAAVVTLIKPQFEVGRSMIGKGGIVKDKKAHRFAIERVLESGKNAGLCPVGLIPSPIAGGDGNREFLVWFSKGRTDFKTVTDQEIRRTTE